MPLYQFRCRACGSSFDVNRPMAQADSPASCPQGHDDTVKILGISGTIGTASAPPPSGGCCGGGCCN
ncbi:MAG: FmdB family transcriptional regulator [Micrococcales bacterium]|nr:FmdB family transcriptional regulator [Micrococcales bacterium]